MEKQLDGNENKELRYVIVELVAEKGTASSIEKGLFKGLKREYGQDFLWIKTASDVTRSCNLAYYNILSIESYDGDVRRFVFFQASLDEQKKALGRIKSMLLSLEGRIHKLSGLIEASRYSNIPDNFGNSCENSSIQKTTVHRHIPTGPAYGYNGYSTYEKKDPEPLAFKRDAKKPTKAALKKLSAKMDLIDKGEYEYKIPEVKEKEQGTDM